MSIFYHFICKVRSFSKQATGKMLPVVIVNILFVACGRFLRQYGSFLCSGVQAGYFSHFQSIQFEQLNYSSGVSCKGNYFPEVATSVTVQTFEIHTNLHFQCIDLFSIDCIADKLSAMQLSVIICNYQ